MSLDRRQAMYRLLDERHFTASDFSNKVLGKRLGKMAKALGVDTDDSVDVDAFLGALKGFLSKREKVRSLLRGEDP